MKRKIKRLANGGLNTDGKISPGEKDFMNSDKGSSTGDIISEVSKYGTDFYSQLVDAKYDPTLAKNEVELAKMNRKLQKRKTTAGSIGGAMGAGASIGTGIGLIGGPAGAGLGAIIGGASGLLAGTGASIWLNSASGRKYKRKVGRLQDIVQKRNVSQSLVGANYLENVNRGMKNGGKKRSKRQNEKDVATTPAARNKKMQAVTIEGLYNHMNKDGLIPKGMDKKSFAGLSQEDVRSLIPDDLYMAKYELDTPETPRTSPYWVNPVYSLPKYVSEAKNQQTNIDKSWSYGETKNYAPGEFENLMRSMGTPIESIPIAKKCGGKVKRMKDGGKLKASPRKYPPSKEVEGKAEGGIIEGPGGPKEDKVIAKLDDGDFIIPANAPADVVSNLIDYLGIDQRADVSQGDEDVPVSNGEVLIPADMTDKANEYLVTNGFENGLDDLAPEADVPYDEGMADGGWVGLNKEYQKFVKQYRADNPNSSDAEVRAVYYNILDNDADKELFLKNKPVSKDVISKYFKPEKIENITPDLDQTRNVVEKTNFDLNKRPVSTNTKPTGVRSKTRLALTKASGPLKDLSTNPLTYAGLAAAGQTIGGLTALNRLGDRPTRKVDQDLSMLATQTANEAMYGIDPRVKSKLEEGRNRDFNNISKSIVEYGAGSSGATYNMLTDALRQKNLSDVELTQLDIAEKERKKDINRGIIMEIVNQRNRIREGEIEQYDTEQQAYSDLFKSGIENVIGLGKYASQQKFYQDVDQNITNAPYIKS
jgi:outer membrane lipoprotein SlyB